jgi:hypothetical protein
VFFLYVVLPMGRGFVHPSLLVDVLALLVTTVRLLLVHGPTLTFRFKAMPLILATTVVTSSDWCFHSQPHSL